MRRLGGGLAALLLAAFLTSGCGSPRSAPASHVDLPPLCATEFMTAFVNGDAAWIYTCSTGQFRHAIDERADASGGSPRAVLAGDLARRTYHPTGEYRLVALGKPGSKAALVGIFGSAHYDLQTDRGPMRITLYLDGKGLVGGVAGPFLKMV
jgi:hypothetical protein